MRRTLSLGVVLAGAALTSSPVVSAAGAAASTRLAADKTFTVYGFENTRFIPAPGTNPKKTSPGDELVINDHLTLPFTNAKKFRLIGHDTGLCTFTRVGRRGGALLQCTTTFVLPHGSIAAEGQIRDNRKGALTPSHEAITGGTGKFRGALGAVLIRLKKVAPRGYVPVFTFTLE